MLTQSAEVNERFQRALDTVVGRLKEDTYVLAAILMGSMSHDVVWEKSDIDLLVITQEVKIRSTALCLTEEDINIHTYIYTRADFKKILEGSLHSSFMHSLLSKGPMLFTRDETISELYDSRLEFGNRDRGLIAMRNASFVLPAFAKAEKWLYVKQDLDYCLVYILACVQGLASVEAVLQGEITGREVIHQALRLNPTFFNRVYTDLLRGDNSRERLECALHDIHDYIYSRIPLVFQPVLDFLAGAGVTRSATEIADHFKKHGGIETADMICEWLADEQIIRKVSSPVRVTEKSRVSVEEAAYYYDPE